MVILKIHIANREFSTLDAECQAEVAGDAEAPSTFAITRKRLTIVP